jgi:DNA repair exonuclease SbcCD ATPase subunit
MLIRGDVQPPELLAPEAIQGGDAGAPTDVAPGVAPETAGELAGKPTTPFYEWSDPREGKKYSFNSPEELHEHLNKSYSRESDYTRKTQALARQRTELNEKIARREQELEDQAKRIKELNDRYTPFKNFIEQRPQVYDQFQRMINQPATAEDAFKRSQGYFDEQISELKKELEDLRGWKQGLDSQKRKDSIFSELGEELGDLDRNAIEEHLASIGNDPKALVRTVYNALRAQRGELTAQKRAAAEMKQQERTKGFVSGGGSAKAPARTYGSIEEARAAAHEELD